MIPAAVSLFTAPYLDREITALFSDEAWLHEFVRVEVALSRAQAAAGAIPSAAAEAVALQAKTFVPDRAALTAAIARDGFPILEFVAQFRAHVGPTFATCIHRGATTQDILDTALVLQLNAGLDRIERHLVALSTGLIDLVSRHRVTIMVGRTHLQAALPITFGLKAAGWLAPLLRHRNRLAELRPRLCVAQCSGAAGTLASLGAQGPAVAAAFATELGLAVPTLPWHAHRDVLLEAAHWLGMVNTSVAKFAHDILLLTQAEIAEVRESTDGNRGKSSAMPQKRNPVASEIILVATRSATAHLLALQFSPPPEHERGTLTCQLEFLHLPPLCALTGGALLAASTLAHDLVVDSARMRANLDATQGTLLAEAATLALSAHLAPADARQLVRESCAAALIESRHLCEILRSRTTAPVAWDELNDESRQLGSAAVFIDRVLAEAATFPALP